MSRRCFAVLAVLVLPCCMTGCTTPSSRHVFEQEDFGPSSLGKDTKILVVTDVCIWRHLEDGEGDYVSVFDSRRACRKASGAISAYLISQGFSEVQTLPLAVGSYLSASAELPVCRYPHGEAFPGKSPFWINEEWLSDSESNTAERAHGLMNPIPVSFRDHPERARALPENDAFREAVLELKRQYGCDYALLLAAGGWFVTEREQEKERTPQLVATAALTLGTIVYAQWQISNINAFVALVDADRGELAWANKFYRDPFQEEMTGKFRAGGLYHPDILIYDDDSPRDVNRSLIERMTDPALQAWCRKPCHDRWLELTSELLYHLAPPQ